MRKIIFIFTFVFIASLGLQAQGVEFNKGTWQEILDLAKEQDKLIFMDAYTTWCGPCKKMSKDIFPQKSVGNFYNKNFINVKMDMEKGEGTMLSDKYGVTVYPTLLFITSDGTLIHRVAGYHDTEQFLDLGNTAIDPSKNLSAMATRFELGDRDANFLLNYAQIALDAYDGSHPPIADAYLATQKDWNTPGNHQFIMKFCDSGDSPMFAYLTENRKAFSEQFGEKEVLSKIQGIVYGKIYENQDITLGEVNALFMKAYPERAAQLSSQYRMTHYRNRGDREGFASSALDHYSKYSTNDPGELNEIAWTFYEVIDKPDYLKGAVKLTKKSIKLEKGYYNMDTLAALYKKLGKKGKAIRTAKKAIKIAKKNGEDASITEDMLAELRNM